jgi:hypothetical protein
MVRSSSPASPFGFRGQGVRNGAERVSGWSIWFQRSRCEAFRIGRVGSCSRPPMGVGMFLCLCERSSHVCVARYLAVQDGFFGEAVNAQGRMA